MPYISQPITEFLSFVDSLIPHDKAKIFKLLFRYPVATNEVTGICFDKLSRIFDGRNPAFNYQFMNAEQRDDWEYYRQEILKEQEIWHQKGWEMFKTEHNCVLIVDLPREQDISDIYPQPYFYFLPISQVVAYEVKKDGIMDWIAFRQPNKQIAVFDDEYFRVFKEENINELGELLSEEPHDLGYCPAKFFWSESLNLQEPDIKSHVISKVLNNLDWFLFFHTSKKHLDLYGSYPIYSGYEQDCNYSNDESGDECDGGFLKDRRGQYKIDSTGQLLQCPKCGNKRIAGAGTFVEVPIPKEKEQADLRNPVQMLGIDRDSLDFNVAEQSRLKNEVITSVCGVDSDLVSNQAINESQVTANFESQTTILNRVKKGFEEAQNFVDSTICKLRYGKLFISSKVNYGTDFYTVSVPNLREQYKTAKESGASEAELDAMQNQIIETEYRHNPTELQRMFVLADLEPFRHMTRDEVLNYYEKALISKEQLIVKLNFSNFVKRFERENTNLLEFGINVPYSKKIEIINQKFLDYAKQQG